MRSFSTNSLLSVGVLLLAGCATSAPSLPIRPNPSGLAEFSPADAKLGCFQIDAERDQIHERMAVDNSRIKDSRFENQLAVGLASTTWIATPALATIKTNDVEKNDLTQLYERQDVLIRLSAAKACKSELDKAMPAPRTPTEAPLRYTPIFN